MEQDLINILLFAKKALHSGQAIGGQADQSRKETESLAEMLETQWPKLLFLNEHITTQLNTLIKVHDFIYLTAGDLQGFIKSKEAALGNLSMAVQQTFDSLKKHYIDPEILEVNKKYTKEHNIDLNTSRNSYMERKTLFDYIDDQAVLDLQQQTDDEISAVEVGMAKSLSNTTQSLQNTQKAILAKYFTQNASSFVIDKKEGQEHALSQMADILNSLLQHYAQVGEAMKVLQANPNELLDIKVLQDDHDHLPDIIDSLQAYLQEVEDIRNDLRYRSEEYGDASDEMAKLFLELEQLGEPKGTLDNIFEKLIMIERKLQEHKDTLNNYFENLWVLVDWYSQYAVSYHYMTIEIARRQKAQQKQTKLLEDCLKKFEDLYIEELENRKEWATKHAAYLPTDLCPFMNEPPPRITFNTSPGGHELPDISPQVVEEAIQRTNSYALKGSQEIP
ncbi:hypothetical protein INT43_008004 [Umbelopsis isabellina]|uniref:Autophagy-related protein 17 n=1 Tax=Mortierella isabellina TaxID=91625 RepID=A0A8H7PNK8_MORIS|nr:hypothetical protein INT43_008004 [Umbelopsis isabellina]